MGFNDLKSKMANNGLLKYYAEGMVIKCKY
jgi:hypothetical protein